MKVAFEDALDPLEGLEPYAGALYRGAHQQHIVTGMESGHSLSLRWACTSLNAGAISCTTLIIGPS